VRKLACALCRVELAALTKMCAKQASRYESGSKLPQSKCARNTLAYL
jgi:hypothetical protein